MKRKLPSLDKRYKRNRPLSPEEIQIWLQKMGEREQQISPEEPVAPVESDKRKTETTVQPITKEPAARLKKKTVSPGTIDSRTHKKLRRETLEIEATIDLHGHTRDSAHAMLIRFIADCRARGMRRVLVITGKGRMGGGALRGLLPLWLHESPLLEAVIAYDKAGPRHGGEGAWYVRIRKRKQD
jgi:DNA-nicking Smr family endonuclease